jgi:hypothetical protein
MVSWRGLLNLKPPNPPPRFRRTIRQVIRPIQSIGNAPVMEYDQVGGACT